MGWVDQSLYGELVSGKPDRDVQTFFLKKNSPPSKWEMIQFD